MKTTVQPRVVKKLPKDAKVGDSYAKIVKGRNGRRKVTFKRTKKKRFGKWRITDNVKA